jgi:enolase
MAKIKTIWARQILDSRAIPTIEAACQLDTGQVAVTSIPSGTSTGSHEALELRDNDPTKYKGLGVYKAVENINKVLGPNLVGADPSNQTEIDQKMLEMDGTENKTKYGANALLAISTAVSKVGAIANNLPLYKWINTLAANLGLKAALKIPTPLLNMINGGKHGAGNLDFQEFLLIPASNKKYSEGLRMAVETYYAIGENLGRRGAIHSVGYEGGYAPNLFTNADAFEVLVESIKETVYVIGQELFLGVDVAANSFYRNGEYTIRDKSAPLDDNGLLEYFKSLNNQYHLALLEDPFFEDAWGSWQKALQELGNQLLIVGDDLLASNPKRLEKAKIEKACNAVIIKPNQIGTVTETIKVIKMTKDLGWKVICSHRSGETNDSFIADFSVGCGADYVKFGAPARGERVAKYNRLLAIENELG